MNDDESHRYDAYCEELEESGLYGENCDDSNSYDDYDNKNDS